MGSGASSDLQLAIRSSAVEDINAALERIPEEKRAKVVALIRNGAQVDKEVGLAAAVSKNNFTVEHLSSVGLVAINQDAFAIEHLYAELKADKEVGLAAVTQNWSAIRLLSPELNAEKEVGLAARKPKHSNFTIAVKIESVDSAVPSSLQQRTSLPQRILAMSESRDEVMKMFVGLDDTVEFRLQIRIKRSADTMPWCEVSRAKLFIRSLEGFEVKSLSDIGLLKNFGVDQCLTVLSAYGYELENASLSLENCQFEDGIKDAKAFQYYDTCMVLHVPRVVAFANLNVL